MRSKFVLTVAASLLAGTMFAAAQQTSPPSGAPSNEGGSDSDANSAQPVRPGGPPGLQRQGPGGTVVAPGTAGQGGPAMRDQTPLQPGGVSPSAPPQGAAGGEEAQPRPR
jgi:hypothetical protein